MSTSCQIGASWRRFPVLLLGVFLFAGCGGEEVQILEGPVFERAPDPVAGGARIYLYWPAEATGTWERVNLYSGSGLQVLQPGGYVEAVVGPGAGRVSASQNWTVNATNLVGVEVGELKMVMEPNHTYFVRVRPKARRLDFELSPVEPEAALPEIQKCRRTIWRPVPPAAAGG